MNTATYNWQQTRLRTGSQSGCPPSLSLPTSTASVLIWTAKVFNSSLKQRQLQNYELLKKEVKYNIQEKRSENQKSIAICPRNFCWMWIEECIRLEKWAEGYSHHRKIAPTLLPLSASFPFLSATIKKVLSKCKILHFPKILLTIVSSSCWRRISTFYWWYIYYCSFLSRFSLQFALVLDLSRTDMGANSGCWWMLPKSCAVQSCESIVKLFRNIKGIWRLYDYNWSSAL